MQVLGVATAEAWLIQEGNNEASTIRNQRDLLTSQWPFYTYITYI